MDANTISTREKIKSGQAEIRSTIGAIVEKMETAIPSMRSEREETIQHRMENVMAEVNQNTEGLLKERNETQKELQVAKASLNTQRDDLMETIRDTKKYLEFKNISFKDNTQNLTSNKQNTMEAKMEPTLLEFQSQLVEIMARADRGRETGACAIAAQSPKFTELHRGQCSGASSRL
jgi:hypothetical protein